MLMFVIEDQPDRAATDLRQALVRRLVHHGSTFSRVGASGDPGAVQSFSHTCFQVMPYESYVALAERLNGLIPISGMLKTALFTTGAEATENAVKIACAATGRPGIIAFTGAFHGRTSLASAMTGKVNPLYAAVENSATEAAPYWCCGRRKTRPVVRLVPLGIGQDVCRGSVRRRSPVRIFGWS